MLNAYYNEYDHTKAEHLRKLIREGKIPDGVVDERDLKEVPPEDLRGFVQCHFFADHGQWPLALRLADWPDDRPVWTGYPIEAEERHYALRGRRFLFHFAPLHVFDSSYQPVHHKITGYILAPDGSAYGQESIEVCNFRGYEKVIQPSQAVPVIKAVMDA